MGRRCRLPFRRRVRRAGARAQVRFQSQNRRSQLSGSRNPLHHRRLRNCSLTDPGKARRQTRRLAKLGSRRRVSKLSAMRRAAPCCFSSIRKTTCPSCSATSVADTLPSAQCTKKSSPSAGRVDSRISDAGTSRTVKDTSNRSNQREWVVASSRRFLAKACRPSRPSSMSPHSAPRSSIAKSAAKPGANSPAVRWPPACRATSHSSAASASPTSSAPRSAHRMVPRCRPSGLMQLELSHRIASCTATNYDTGMTIMPLRTKRLVLNLLTREETLAMVDAMSPEDRAQVSPDWLAALRASDPADPWRHGFSIMHRDTGHNVGKLLLQRAADRGRRRDRLRHRARASLQRLRNRGGPGPHELRLFAKRPHRSRPHIARSERLDPRPHQMRLHPHRRSHRPRGRPRLALGNPPRTAARITCDLTDR